MASNRYGVKAEPTLTQTVRVAIGKKSAELPGRLHVTRLLVNHRELRIPDRCGEDMVPLMNPPGATLLDASRIWEPYVEAILARQKQAPDGPRPVTTSERKTGVYVPNVETPQLVRVERGWLRRTSGAWIDNHEGIALRGVRRGAMRAGGTRV